ncbi:MAG: Eco57I restriction-modification methylase domain-containing protein [Candidatus Brocadiia bacterium]
MGKAPQVILDLVEHFERNIASYRAAGYNEAQVRTEFIDPMFEALGWDMANRAGNAEAYKDVIHEDAIKVGGVTKAPDYCFRIGGARKFFLEAKRPAVDIVYDADAAYQLRRYAWSSKLPLSILTDFEEFAVYDCRVRPNRGDTAAQARIYYMKFSDYAERWAEIADVFSKEAVLRGSFDKFAESARGKRGTSEVDAEFLKEIEQWREKLARNFSLRNESISVPQLNSAVQSTIDRIVFLRMCEDRGIEQYGQLQALVSGERTYRRLIEVFYRADERYNSGLFHFNVERGRPSHPDEFTPELKLDDEVLKEIIGSLYYPRSPYEFGVLPPEILGNVYEQFLGKVIRLTVGHNAKVEEKPEVRKAGGVYYTPQYIVDYIVKNTVEELCKGKSPKAIEKLRILDPACGSGSFLLGAYKRLLEYHRDWYIKDGPTWYSNAKAIYQGRGGQWFLTTAEKKRILLNNIYGVDIDRQAVEVTKLSLLLKVLEDESSETLAHALRTRHQRALPDIDGNIKCGNSLIGWDFYNDRDPKTYSDAERWRINAFDWRDEFPAVFKAGGFDAVIGNPPYVRPHNLEARVKGYFWQHYKSFVKKADLYCCFIERSISLLRTKGAFGFIVSSGWLRLDSFEILRKILLDETALRSIIEFEDNVFHEATVRTLILTFSKGRRKSNRVLVARTKADSNLSAVPLKTILQEAFRGTYKSIFDLSMDGNAVLVKDKVRARSIALGNDFEISFGLKTGDDSRFLSSRKMGPKYKPLLRGEDVHRYCDDFKGEYVWYVPEKMRAHRKTARPGEAERFEQPKALVRDTGHGLQSTFDDNHYYVKDVLIVCHKDKNAERLKFLVGLINSRLMRFYYETSFPTLHVQRDELASLPIATIDVSDPAAEDRYERMVQFVERMLILQKRLAKANVADEKTRLEREMKETDGRIDRLVYELYGLTKKEIRIVEEASA